MDTTHISKCANAKVRSIFHVLNKIIFSTICKYITAPILCAVETFCFRYVTRNTLHKIADKSNSNKKQKCSAKVKCYNNSSVCNSNKLTPLERLHHVILCPIFDNEIYEWSLQLNFNLLQRKRLETILLNVSDGCTLTKEMENLNKN